MPARMGHTRAEAMAMGLLWVEVAVGEWAGRAADQAARADGAMAAAMERLTWLAMRAGTAQSITLRTGGVARSRYVAMASTMTATA